MLIILRMVMVNDEAVAEEERPLVHIGWLAIHDGRDERLEEAYENGAQRLETSLQDQFGMFTFRVETLERRRYAAQGTVDPVDLLEIGLHEKTFHHWDYALVLTPNELLGREQAFMLGAPSSALETAVMSTLSFREEDQKPARLAALALYYLGHMWGLPVSEEGVMQRRDRTQEWVDQPFSKDERRIIIDRLEDVADDRLEEKSKPQSRAWFLWQAFWADPKSVLTDILGYRPWRQPFRLGGLTAAAWVTTLLLFLAAESWELGVQSRPVFLLGGAVLSITGAATYLYRGQNLGRLPRTGRLLEQLERSRLILFCCLLIGMAALWLILFTGALLIGLVLPRAVIGGWVDASLGPFDVARFAAFAAMIGVAAAALGGNLEDEGAMKARFFFDEET